MVTLPPIEQLPCMFERLGNMSNNNKVYDEATKVTAEDGEVVLDGPDGVDVALTPEAALETGGRLIDQAAVAAGQKCEARIDHRPK
jgi:hypothetical protein